MAEGTGSNKKRIFEAAVKLFASRSYSEVSMREIATEVGIRASSIYNHYASKEALLDAIFQYFRERLLQEVYPRIAQNFADVQAEPKEFLLQSVSISMSFMRLPVLTDIASIMIREQFNNAKIRAFLCSELIENPRKIFVNFFTQLQKRGLMKSIDPEMAAKEYLSYSLAMFYESSLLLSNGSPDLVRSEQEQRAHVEFFWNVITQDNKED